MLVLERVEIGTNYTHQRKAAVLGGTQKASHLFSTATKDSPLQGFRHFKHPMNSYFIVFIHHTFLVVVSIVVLARQMNDTKQHQKTERSL